MFVSVKELPSTLQDALSSVGYGRKDVSVEAKETYCLQNSGGDGYRGFAVAVNLATGERKSTYGSWGGANMFNPNNAVDLDSRQHKLVPGFAIVEGWEGGGRPVYASVLLHPQNFNSGLLPAKKELELSKREQLALVVCKEIKGGHRAEQLENAFGFSKEARKHAVQYSAGSPEYQKLKAFGLISINKAGAIALTTEGKNYIQEQKLRLFDLEQAAKKGELNL